MISRCLAIALVLAACGSGDGPPVDAGLDAQPRLALTVDGTSALQTTTRSLKVTITASGITRNDTFPVGGLPATVDVPQPIFLTTWDVVVDGFDTNGQRIGHGTTTLPAGTAEASVSIAPL